MLPSPSARDFLLCSLHAEEQSLMLAKAMSLSFTTQINLGVKKKEQNTDPCNKSSQFDATQTKYPLTV